MATTCDFLLVIPAYEEHQRLPPFLRDLVRDLAEAPYTIRILIVDDGSSEISLRELAGALSTIENSNSVDILPLLKLHGRQGKGSAIRAGWNSCLSSRWLAFVDADGAVPAYEVRRIFDSIRNLPETDLNRAFVSIRSPGQDSRVRRKWLRRITGRLFARLVNVAWRCSFQDPQCGFKVIPFRTWESLGVLIREKGFCFDLELLLLLNNSKVPIQEILIAWQEKSDGHFLLFPDGIMTLLTSVRLWFRSKLWVTR